MWLSVIGSTEGPPRDGGPPRRTARDIVDAVEPQLEVARLNATSFSPGDEASARAWVLVARRREAPAQPSTRH